MKNIKWILFVLIFNHDLWARLPLKLSDIPWTDYQESSYEIVEPLWSDGVDKTRKVFIPKNKVIDFVNGELVFPVGTILEKQFILSKTSSRTIERRLGFFDGKSWLWATYVFQRNSWTKITSQQNLSLRIQNQESQKSEDLSWTLFSPNECLYCHAQGSPPLGFRLEQFNEAQRKKLVEQKYLVDSVLNSNKEIWRSSKDQSLALTDRVKVYLQVNCASCHNSKRLQTIDMNLEWSNPLEKMNLIQVAPKSGTIGIKDAFRVTPGDLNKSILRERMHRLDEFRMPKFGSKRVDPHGLSLIEEWIQSL